MTGAGSLFDAFGIGGLTLRNRFVMSPMTRSFSPGGIPGGNVAAYYRRRAEGGVGLIVTEGTGIDHPAAIDHADIPRMAGEAAAGGWSTVVEQVHAAGGRIFPQLWHQGPLLGALIGASPPQQLRPSGHWGSPGVHSLDPDYVERAGPPARAMTEEDIADVVHAYARSARAAQRIGFDGIAIHGAHGYLIDSFLWEDTNRRDDRWGGDLTRRSRFAVETVRAIRAAVGEGFPILFRFSQHKSQDYRARLAQSPDQLETLLGPIADAGVDIFDASTRRFWDAAFAGSELNLAGWARKLTGRPAMMVGGAGLPPGPADGHWRAGASGADTIARAAEWIARGDVDLIGVGRALLANPDLVRRVAEGQPLAPFDPALTRTLA
ncbi:NADH:flavin oxidoreductase [Sphingomonas colocasiae]|uniref:NADH:flavin oxidoreductase n=1 Tax=Sphingomonas colocasiae TaxID=1848973 RepID=A0ABS7PVB5_9SPHN|nr:NADH:flavin oxidoreductase [Sphingomonas colocasiae]MBY8825223.1 NADH:flavin oxidoreductase [Sphingomonas colocasiae]